MVQVEMSNMYIDMGANDGSEKWTGKNTAATSRLLEYEIYALKEVQVTMKWQSRIWQKVRHTDHFYRCSSTRLNSKSILPPSF